MDILTINVSATDILAGDILATDILVCQGSQMAEISHI